MILVTIPGLRLVSEANARDRWARQKRAKTARQAAKVATICEAPYPALPLTVTITRIAPGRLDSDNLASSAKAVRDGVADALGIDDGDSAVTWLYAQRKAGVREYAVEIAIAEGRACSLCGVDAERATPTSAVYLAALLEAGDWLAEHVQLPLNATDDAALARAWRAARARFP